MTPGAWTPARLAAAAGGTLVAGDPELSLRGTVSSDTRLLTPGDVFVALPGEHVDGGLHVPDALRAGAAGVVAAPGRAATVEAPAFAIAVTDPHAALRRLAAARRAALSCVAVGVTGAAGKTTTTDILAALLGAELRTHATRHGFNTPQGVAATIAAAPPGTEALVVELGMRRHGQIAAGAELLAPHAAIVTNVGPEHLELVGTVEDVARNKAELIAALPAGAVCVVPFGEPLLAPHLRDDVRTISHGPGGDVALRAYAGGVAEIDCAGERVAVEIGSAPSHRLRNLVAAVALAWALGRAPHGRRVEVAFSPLRWQRASLGALELLLDCAKTSPLALASALEDFAAEPAAGRRIAVLGPLAELGADAERYQREAGETAARLGLDVLVAVEPEAHGYLAGYDGAGHAVADVAEARALLARIGRDGDRVLVKGPRRSALERIVSP